MFAALALHGDAPVTMGFLLDAVWGAKQPTSARQLVHTYVARLRSLFEPEMPPRARFRVIASTASGYQLRIDNDMVDLARFQRLRSEAKRHLAANETARAYTLLSEGMRLWRDPALTELSALLRITHVLDALRQEWRDAALDYVEAGLELGDAPAVLPVAQRLAAAEPMHEGVQARYVTALEETGQRAAAIEHFNSVRTMLSDELGVVPGPHLARVYRRVLLGAEPHRTSRPVTTVPAPSRPPWHGPGPGVSQLVDRERDLDMVMRALTEDRLVTLTGPPGCGKSVLALKAAARLRDGFLGGVVVLECSKIAEATTLTGALATALGGSTLDDPANLLDDLQALIVLDNVEHFVDACAVVVDDLLRRCRRISVIVTSREPLSLPYETVHRLLTLTLSAGDEAGWVGDRPAVRLFARRAEQVCPNFRLGPDNAEQIAMICGRLDNLPLAIELAAACMATDTLDQLVDRVNRPLHEINPVRRGTPTHQRSLRNALRRSVECLSARERWCFRQLGRLPAHFQPSEASVVWARAPGGAVDTRAMLNRLVDKSLLFVRHESNTPVYSMLRLMHRLAVELAGPEEA